MKTIEEVIKNEFCLIGKNGLEFFHIMILIMN